MQFKQAAARLEAVEGKVVLGRPLTQWLGSELAFALLLDEHVNHPAHVPGTLAAALSAAGMAGQDPRGWSDRDEQRAISAYLDARDRTSMTDSRGRARKIEAHVAAGRLSDRRGSFA